MPKKFLNGLIFGAGFAIALLVVLAVAIYFVLPAMIVNGVLVQHGPEMVYGPPDVEPTKRFLGTSAVYDGKFSHDRDRELSTGPGRILGTANVNGKPLPDFRLRLALNGSVMSQWATTDSNGRYEIGVPYGEYRIDGYEFDRATADAVLTGKIGHPRNAYSSGTFEVSGEAPGRGLNFKFVDPVKLDISKKIFSADEEVVIGWEPYPGASEYTVQVFEKADPHAVMGEKAVFPWSQLPVAKEPFINLSDNIELKAGHYYRVEVEALSNGWSAISNTGRRYSGFDFEVAE